MTAEITCRVVGLGGIGQVVALYLGLYLASRDDESRLILIDGDTYESANASRMSFSELGNKAEIMREDLLERHDMDQVTVLAIPQYVTPGNIQQVLPSGPRESILLCVDNHATRQLVAEHAAQLQDVCLVSGGNDGVGVDGSGVERSGTAGNVQVYARRDGVDRAPTLWAYHPEIASPADQRPADKSCAELVASGSQPQVLFTNLMAATWMLNAWYWLHRQDQLAFSELVFDTPSGRAAPLPLPPVA